MDQEIQEFDRAARRAIAWITDYYKHIEQLPVKSRVHPGEVYASIPDQAPEEGQSYDKIINDLDTIILPGITHWQHPSFHAYFNANSSFPSIIGEIFTSAIAAQCMLWDTSPAATELEEKMMEWLKSACGLPAEWHGSIQDTASTANLCAIISAREWITNFHANKAGLFGHRRLIIYCSDQAHSSIEKAVRLAGLGSESLRKISVDQHFAMKVDLLEEAIQSDLQLGYTPTTIVAAAGTTGSLAIDPLEQLGKLARKHNLWYHIDAAHAGNAMILPEKRYLLKGIELADSYVFNPHKWMFTNFDCSAYFVNNKEILINTMGIFPEYLKTSGDDHVNNYKDWGIQLGRRFRALKLWFVLRHFGLKGIRDRFKEHMALTNYFVDLIQRDGRFELLSPVVLNLVCFRYNDGKIAASELNTINQKILNAVNASGKAYITHTVLNGNYTLRCMIGQTHVAQVHVDKLYRLLCDTVEPLEES